MPPEVWFAGKPKEYLDMHAIPPDAALWRIERFDDFIIARKEIIRKKFASLIVKVQNKR